MNELSKTSNYSDWLKGLKQRVRQAQLKAAVQVNTTLLMFYWELGADMVERQKSAKWSSGFLKQLSADLMAEFPDRKGFNVEYASRLLFPWRGSKRDAYSTFVTAREGITSD